MIKRLTKKLRASLRRFEINRALRKQARYRQLFNRGFEFAEDQHEREGTTLDALFEMADSFEDASAFDHGIRAFIRAARMRRARR